MTLLRAAFLFGLVLRLVIWSQTSALGTEIMDEQQFVQLATSILHGQGLAWTPGAPTSLRPPLYPGMLAALFALAGPDSMQLVRLLQILLSAATAIVVYLLGRRAFGPMVGAWAAAITWLYPSLIFFDFMLLTETTFTLFLMMFLLFSVTLLSAPSKKVAVACGLSLGLAALTRSVLWPVPLLFCPLLVALLRGPAKTRVMLSALVLVGYVSVVGPWAVRNTRVQGVVTIVDTMGGFNLRMGNYEYTPDDRMWDAVAFTGERNWSYALSQEYPGRHFTEGEKEKWAQRMAIKYMIANPGITVRRAFIKFADFWGLEREFIAGVQKGMFAPPRWFAVVGSAATLLGYVSVVLLGAAGMWLALPEWRIHLLLLLPVAIITGAHTIVFGHSRYHVPLMPIFGLYAAALFAQRGRVKWRHSRLAVAGAALSVAILLTIWIRQIVLVDLDRIRAAIASVG